MVAFDVSRPLRPGMAVYKDRDAKRFLTRQDAQFPVDGMRESSSVQWNLHTGTHVDAPAHMLPDGGTVASLDLSVLAGPARVVSWRGEGDRLDAAAISAMNPQRGERLLVHTRNSDSDVFDSEFVFLAEDGARVLAEAGISLFALDAMGIERSQPGHPSHNALMGAGIVVMEDVRLDGVPDGEYTLLAMPVSLPDSEAAPVRALLLPRDWCPGDSIVLSN